MINEYPRLLIAGGIAGAVCAAIWGGTSYFTGLEIGWIAWGIGFVVGMAMHLAGPRTTGIGPGALAVVLSIVAIVAGKYFASQLVVHHHMKNLGLNAAAERKMDDSQLQRDLGYEIAGEFQSQGKKLAWPLKKEPAAVASPAAGMEFPADVWKETLRRWGKMTPDEKKQRSDAAKDSMQRLMVSLRQELAHRGFLDSFSPFDALWFLLAALTAYRTGSGNPPNR